MKINNNISNLFTNNDCLTKDALEKYILNILSYEEKQKVEKHIKECDFCKDAAEGLKKLHKKSDFNKTIKSINKDLRTRLYKRLKSKRYLERNSNIIRKLPIIAAAASVLLIVGSFGYLSYLWDKKNDYIAEEIKMPKKEITKKSVSKQDELIKSITIDDKEKKETVSDKKDITSKHSVSKETEYAETIIVVENEYAEEETEEKTDISYDEGGSNIAGITVKEEIKTEILSEEKIITDELKVSDNDKQLESSKIAEVYDTELNRKKSLSSKKRENKSFVKETTKTRSSYGEKKTKKSETNIPATYYEEEKDEAVFIIVEEMPEFPGGDSALQKYICENLKYPETAKENGISGNVFVEFLIDKKGKVKDAKILRGVEPSLDKEALRVIKNLPKWKPGKQRGELVDVLFTIPVKFELP
ncbi:MAG: energy transducer TonB [Bacteroidales bacterium]|nr:energy transducer TonB [Bacteroidales bacterium]